MCHFAHMVNTWNPTPWRYSSRMRCISRNRHECSQNIAILVRTSYRLVFNLGPYECPIDWGLVPLLRKNTSTAPKSTTSSGHAACETPVISTRGLCDRDGDQLRQRPQQVNDRSRYIRNCWLRVASRRTNRKFSLNFTYFSLLFKNSNVLFYLTFL